IDFIQKYIITLERLIINESALRRNMLVRTKMKQNKFGYGVPVYFFYARTGSMLLLYPFLYDTIISLYNTI
ncbi:hypothetical protein BDA99DRAFT_499529, partial [Phascolomyces articulosus]